MLPATSATVALTAFIVIVFMLACRFLDLVPFGLPVEMDEFLPRTVISSQL